MMCLAMLCRHLSPCSMHQLVTGFCAMSCTLRPPGQQQQVHQILSPSSLLSCLLAYRKP
jgi:hypothetical protein